MEREGIRWRAAHRIDSRHRLGLLWVLAIGPRHGGATGDPESRVDVGLLPAGKAKG